MITKTLKKLLIINIFLILSFNVFGKNTSEIVKDDSGAAELSISSDNKFGKIVYSFKGIDQDEKVQYVVVKVGNDYYNQNGELLYDQVGVDLLFGTLELSNVNNLTLDDKSFTTGTAQIVIDFSLLANTEITNDVEVEIDTTIDEIDLKVWTVSSSGNVYNITTKVKPEFFTDEKSFYDDLFTNSEQLTYTQKIIFFMSTFFITETKDTNEIVTGIVATAERANFIVNACELYSDINPSSIPAISSVIKSSEFAKKYPLLIKAQNRFKVHFESHFQLRNEDVKSKTSEDPANREGTLPFLDINKNSFDNFYGNKNPYIAIYLNYIFKEDTTKSKKSKPLLGYLINKKINENNSNEIKFDYNQYRQISANEGVSLAKSALKYMTWGVEYTTSANSDVENNSANNKVYRTNKTDIENWVTNIGISNDKKSLNYFNGNVENLSRPFTIGATTALGQLYIKELLTTPFNGKQGNPLAFAPMGIDTPKTFNYKMLKQHDARKWIYDENPNDKTIKDNFKKFFEGLTETTMSSEIFNNGYIDEIEFYKQLGVTLKQDVNKKYKSDLPTITDDQKKIKPFLPGIKIDSNEMYSKNINSMYHPNKVAGVDSLGLLLGALSMSEISGDILNVFNTKLNIKLDEFNKSLPEYHINNNNNVLNKPYRLTKPDIERATVIIPDLSLIREGDLLVKYTETEAIIGIIVSADFTGLNSNSTVEDYMKKVLVVSTNSGFRMANVGVWLSSNNMFGGFTTNDEAKSYHVRRLLVKPSSINTTNSYVKDNLELFDTTLLNLDVSFETINGNNLIPNTGEPLVFKKIIIKGDYGNDPVSLKDEDSTITLLPPLDPYNSEEGSEPIATDKSNIFRNKGSGFEFYASDGKNNILLATFYLKGTPTNQDGESPYTISYNSSIFETTGKTKENFLLKVENNKLVFKNKTNSAINFSLFSIRPVETGIRPGDDLQLRFALQDNNIIEGVTTKDDMISVYDKKMLWRANLYIDETGEDWNDKAGNRWNAPPDVLSGDNKGKAIETAGHYSEFGFITANNGSDTSKNKWYGINEWNKVYDGKDRLATTNEPAEAIYLANLKINGDGGQVVKFNNFTNNPKISNGKKPESNVVAYSYGSSDSPFEFNDELRQQQIILSNYYNVLGDKFKKPKNTWPNKKLENFTVQEYKTYISDTYSDITAAPSDFVNITKCIPTDGWAQTTTPSREWITGNEKNYIKPSDLWTDVSDTANYLGTYSNGAYSGLAVPNSSATTEMENFPYLPGWALWYYFANNYTVPPDWVNAISAGVDCNGFVSRAASYSGRENEVYKSRNEDVTNRVDWFTNPQYPYYKLIAGKEYVVVSDKISNMVIGDDLQNLNKIKPGDLMYLENTNANYLDEGKHIAMVLDVELNENMDLTNIKLIESTWDDDKLWAKVINSYTLSNYINKNWVIVRLKK